jgi:hypothetical protein
MSNDPFASASAGAASSDPFGQKPSEIKTSDFPKMDELNGDLLVIQPTKLERVPNRFGKEGDMQDRVTADVTVIDKESPAKSVTHKDMYLSQGALVGQVKGFIETRGMLLGTLRRHMAKGTPDQTPKSKTNITGPDTVDLLIKEWLEAGAPGTKPQFAWKLADFTGEEKDQALVWFRSKTGN